MATKQSDASVLAEETTVDKLGNTVPVDNDEEEHEPTRREIRDAERKARLGPAVTPPDRRRGADRGSSGDDALVEGERVQDKMSEMRHAEQLYQLEQKTIRRQFDRHGGYGHSMKDKKSKQGWGNPLDADLDDELEMDPNDPAADQPSP